MEFAKTVNVLGTVYTITEVPDEESKGLVGVTDFYTKEIKISNMQGVNSESLITDDIDSFKKEVLRHEITHAFLHESGLDMQNGECESWANNETMVDWIALQGEKIHKAYQEVGCLG